MNYQNYMQNFFDLFYQIKAIPFHITFKKFFFKFYVKRENALLFKKDRNMCTYIHNKILTNLKTFPFQIPISYLETHKATIFNNAEELCNHNFSYLGVSANHSLLELNVSHNYNNENVLYSKSIASTLPQTYTFLDWQKDFQSGYRFSENTWFKKIRYEYIHGVDVKNPIEFGRLQHLHILIYACILSKDDNNKHDKYKNEFQNQLLDFISQNPPRFGIQWLVSMDVGIRLFNIVVAYSIAISNEISFNSTFENILLNSILDHCKHIFTNLEWSSGMRGNHYLANLTGLLSGALLLPDSVEDKDIWIFFASEQLLNELLFQFQEDGSNFEDSTCYHRLSAEIQLYGIALVLYLPTIRNNLPPKLQSQIDSLLNGKSLHSGRLQAMYGFSKAIIQSQKSFKLLQIGDDDSGRLCKLDPQFDFPASPIVNAYHLLEIFEGFQLRTSSVTSLCISNLLQQKELQFKETDILKLEAFPNFGLYRYNRNNATIFFRCNESLGQLGKGGHTHNDLLSILLSVNNERILVDPGTYTYTPYPETRNLFRSTVSHNTLSIEGLEQNKFIKGAGHNLFWLRHTANAKVLFYDETMIVMEHSGYKVPHRREVKFYENQVIGVDYCKHLGIKHIYFHFAPECLIERLSNGIRVNSTVSILVNTSTPFTLEEYDYSPKYGTLVSAKRMKIEMNSVEIQWRIEY